MRRRHFVKTGAILAAGAACGCDRILTAKAESHEPGDTDFVEAWDPVDVAFAGCAGGG